MSLQLDQIDTISAIKKRKWKLFGVLFTLSVINLIVLNFFLVYIGMDDKAKELPGISVLFLLIFFLVVSRRDTRFKVVDISVSKYDLDRLKSDLQIIKSQTGHPTLSDRVVDWVSRVNKVRDGMIFTQYELDQLHKKALEIEKKDRMTQVTKDIESVIGKS